MRCGPQVFHGGGRAEGVIPGKHNDGSSKRCSRGTSEVPALVAQPNNQLHRDSRLHLRRDPSHRPSRCHPHHGRPSETRLTMHQHPTSGGRSWHGIRRKQFPTLATHITDEDRDTNDPVDMGRTRDLCRTKRPFKTTQKTAADGKSWENRSHNTSDPDPSWKSSGRTAP